MRYLLLLPLILLAVDAGAQFNQLVLRKNGMPVKRYAEGSEITIQTKLGLTYTGIIYLLQNDSVYFAEEGIRISEISVVYKRKKSKEAVIPMSKEAFLYANAGIPLFATILYLGGQPFWPSLAAGATLVYAPLLLYNAQRILFRGNRVYRLGETYSLQLLDLYPSERLPPRQ